MSTKDKLPSQLVKSKRGGRRSTSWKPGQSGNPKGAPRRGMSWKEKFAEYAESETPPELRKYGKTYADVLIASAFRHAIRGNSRMAHEIIERSEMDDRVPVPRDLTTTDEEIRRDLRAHHAKLLVAASQDPERTKKLLTLEAQRLDIERQISELSTTPPYNNHESPPGATASN